MITNESVQTKLFEIGINIMLLCCKTIFQKHIFCKQTFQKVIMHLSYYYCFI